MAFEFFRKYQKPILYTAGFFALVTFSISGALLSFFSKSAADVHEGAKMTLPGGRVVSVTFEDAVVGRAMRRAAGDPAVVLPYIGDQQGGESEVVERYAALRRLAIEFGFEASDIEVDRAIQRAIDTYQTDPSVHIDSPTQLALGLGYSSLQGYRHVIEEALRIGTFVRTMTLGADTTDAALAKSVLADEEKVTLRVAYLSKKECQDRFEKEGVSDEELKKWLADLDDTKRAPFTSTNKVSLAAVGLLYDGFDPAAYADELKGVQIDDAKLKQEYQFRKDQLFKRPKPSGPAGGNGSKSGGGKNGGGKNGGGKNGGGKNGGGKNGGGEKPAGAQSGGQQGGKAGEEAGGKAAEKAGGKAGEKPAEKPPEKQQGATPPETSEKPVEPPAKKGESSGKQESGQPPAGPPGGALLAAESPQNPPQKPRGAQKPQGGRNPGKGGQKPGKPGAKAPGNKNNKAGKQQPSPYLPFAKVKGRLLKMLQAEAVLDAVRNGPIQKAFYDFVREQTLARNDATRQLQVARKALADAEDKAKEDPENEELKTAVDTAKADVETKEAAEKAAREALEKRRAEFDFAARMREVLGDRPGVAVHVVPDPVDSEGLKDLGDLGTWTSPYTVQSLAKGEIATRLERTDKACFYFQVPEVVVRPLKPFDEIAERARSEYFAAKADEFADKEADKVKDKLVELAKAKIPDEIAKIEKKHADEVTTELDSWRAGLQEDLEKAKQVLQTARPNSKAARLWQKHEAEVEAKLAKEDDKRTELEAAVKEESDKEIHDAARKAYKDVLAEAVEGTGFKIKTLPAYSKNVSERPRFEERYDDAVKFLFKDYEVAPKIKELKPGDATDMLDDKSGRALYVAVCEAVEPATVSDLTRRQMLSQRDSFIGQRMTETMRQSFSIDALKARWSYKPAKVEEETGPSKPKS